MEPAETSLTNPGRLRTVRDAGAHLAIGKTGGVDRADARPSHTVYLLSRAARSVEWDDMID